MIPGDDGDGMEMVAGARNADLGEHSRPVSELLKQAAEKGDCRTYFWVAQRPDPQHARFWRDGVGAVHRCDNSLVFSDGFSRPRATAGAPFHELG